MSPGRFGLLLPSLDVKVFGESARDVGCIRVDVARREARRDLDDEVAQLLLLPGIVVLELVGVRPEPRVRRVVHGHVSVRLSTHALVPVIPPPALVRLPCTSRRSRSRRRARRAPSPRARPLSCLRSSSRVLLRPAFLRFSERPPRWGAPDLKVRRARSKERADEAARRRHAENGNSGQVSARPFRPRRATLCNRVQPV